uniref:Reactive oxygen species modulator 1 n=1 Tax=Panagrolaimus superbus TaxID=310955 RepID=A0A914XV25_9BILA
MAAESEQKRRYMTPKEYLDVQRERGGCTEDFKETMKRSATLGLAAGIPFGGYVAYMNGHRSFKPFISKTFLTTVTSTSFFGILGILIGTFNCLRVKK